MPASATSAVPCAAAPHSLRNAREGWVSPHRGSRARLRNKRKRKKSLAASAAQQEVCLLGLRRQLPLQRADFVRERLLVAVSQHARRRCRALGARRSRRGRALRRACWPAGPSASGVFAVLSPRLREAEFAGWSQRRTARPASGVGAPSAAHAACAAAKRACHAFSPPALPCPPKAVTPQTDALCAATSATPPPGLRERDAASRRGTRSRAA